jgi:hypothetical protein
MMTLFVQSTKLLHLPCMQETTGRADLAGRPELHARIGARGAGCDERPTPHSTLPTVLEQRSFGVGVSALTNVPNKHAWDTLGIVGERWA